MFQITLNHSNYVFQYLSLHLYLYLCIYLNKKTNYLTYLPQMCHVHGCNKDIQDDDNNYYKCSDGHASEEEPAVVYRVNLVMKSSGGTDTTLHKVRIISVTCTHTYSFVDILLEHVQNPIIINHTLRPSCTTRSLRR